MSLYEGDMQSRIMAGEKMEDVLKNQLPIDVKPTSEAVKQQNLLGGGRTLTTEDKFYEMLGIKKTDGTGWGLQSRPVGRLLVAVVLVAGYFAYKKYKK
jgi:hypothetical protein